MTRLSLVGRDFEGFGSAASAHAHAWPGDVDAHWLGLRDLQHLMLGTSAGRDGTVDLVVVPADWLPALADAGAVRSLTPLLERRPPQGWPGDWSPSFHEGVGYDGQVWGLPFHDGPQLLFTRTDLYDDERERTDFHTRYGDDLAPARTWDDLLRQAAHFTRPPGLFGTVLAGAPDGHNNVYDFAVQLWLRDGDLLEDGLGGEVALDSTAALDALLFLRDVANRVVTPAAHSLDSVQSGEEFAAGRVATMLNWAGFAAFGHHPGSPVHRRTRCDLAPTAADGTPTTTVNAFWATAITAGCTDAEAAWDYVVHSTSPAMDRATTRAGSSGARSSTWDDPELLADHPEQALFRAAHQHSRPLWRIPELPAVVDVLSTLVDDVVWRAAPAEPRLTAAARQVRALLGSHPPKAALEHHQEHS